MHWLRGFSLACSLLAAALLPGPREAPAAAFESELGFSSEAEPDAGEAKVGAGRALRAGLLGDRGIRAAEDPEPAVIRVCLCHRVYAESKISEWSAHFPGEKFPSLPPTPESCY